MDISLLAADKLSMGERFYNAFIQFDRWKLYFEGLEKTLIIAVLACLVGVTIGILLALINYVNKKTGKLKVLSLIANTYITLVRGTPVVLQMFIMYLVVFVSVPIDLKIGNVVWESGGSMLIGGLTFGINSGAYVAEIVRAGFESVDDGQMEAGRSLGLSTAETMGSIVTPQAVRNTLPPLFNEFITLVKEGSIRSRQDTFDNPVAHLRHIPAAHHRGNTLPRGGIFPYAHTSSARKVAREERPRRIQKDPGEEEAQLLR